MSLTHLRIEAVRCLARVELALHPRCNYIVGPNGAGKTSILEAAYLLGRGRSFRTRQLRKLVQSGTKAFSVFGEVREADGRRRRLGIGWDAGRVEKRLDGGPAQMAELASVLPVHAIDPGLHYLIEGEPSERRRFLDWGVFHVEPGYLAAWRQYRRVLGQRNAALKAAKAAVELRAWTQALAAAGTEVHRARAAYAAKLNDTTRAFGFELLGIPVELEYKPGWPADRSLEEALAEGEPGDRLHGVTQAGPHRADLRVLLDTQRVRDEASRGQQKLVAIALVLGQVQQHYAVTHRPALVLVDDPAAELDQANLERLLAVLARLPAQLIVTSLTGALVPADTSLPVFHVERGQLKQL